MKYELKKLFASRYIVLLLLCMFLLNGVLFYKHCTARVQKGYTLAQQKEKFQQADRLPDEAEELEARLMADLYGTTEDDSLLTGDVVYEINLDTEVLRQIEEATEYPNFLSQKVAEIEALQNMGFLGAPDSYLYRAQDVVKAQYRSLIGLEVPAVFSGGVKVLADWRLTDLLLFVCLLVGGLLLFTEEQAKGTLLLLRPTAQGKSGLFFRKLLAMLLFAVAACLLFYGTNLLLSATLLGLGDLSRPLQSVTSFRACALPLTVFGYLLQGFFDKLLWICAVSALIVVLSVLAKKPVIAVLLYAAAFAAAYFLGQSKVLLLQNLSLVTQSSAAARYQEYLLLNILGIPTTEMAIFYALCGITILLSCLAALLVFCRRDTVAVKRRALSGLPIGRHTNLLRHEAYKVWITQNGAILLIVLCLLQYASIRTVPVQISERERYDRHYSEILSGPQTPEKEAFLKEEADRFVEIHEKINTYYENCQDTFMADMLTQELRTQLRPEDAFVDAYGRYMSLREGESYVHSTGYQRLFGWQGITKDLLHTVFFELILVLSLSGCFSREKETGVEVLQTSAGAKRRVFRRKLLLAALLALIMTVVSYLPQVLLIEHVFGLPQQNALAGGLTILSGVPASWHIWMVFVLTWFVRLALAAVSTAVILFVSKKTGSTVTTILICTAVLALPPAIGLMLYQ